MTNNDNNYLVILRHGGCEGDALSEHGRERIHSLAQALQQANIKPDIIITSTTGRTRETSKILHEHFNDVADVEKNLFMLESRDRREINALLKNLPDDCHTAFFSGHAETVMLRRSTASPTTCLTKMIARS